MQENKLAAFTLALFIAFIGSACTQVSATSPNSTVIRLVKTAPTAPKPMSAEDKMHLCAVFDRVGAATKNLKPESGNATVERYGLYIDKLGQITEVKKYRSRDDPDFDTAIRAALVGYNVSPDPEGLPEVISIGIGPDGQLQDNYHCRAEVKEK